MAVRAMLKGLKRGELSPPLELCANCGQALPGVPEALRKLLPTRRIARRPRARPTEPLGPSLARARALAHARARDP